MLIQNLQHIQQGLQPVTYSSVSKSTLADVVIGEQTITQSLSST